MKKIIFTLLLGFTFIGFSQNTVIPDPNFELALIELGLDTLPIDGLVPTANIIVVTELDVINKNISNLTGIEGFTALTDLSCAFNLLTGLDVSQNTELIELDCYDNLLTDLDVSANTQLEYLDCGVNQLIGLDFSLNTALTQLYCQFNQLTGLDVSQNTALTRLDCGVNQLTGLDVSANTALTQLYCDGNQLTDLDVSQNTALIKLDCYDNLLTSLDVSENTALTRLFCFDNQLTGSLDLSNNSLLTWFECQVNKIETLNIKNGNNTNLTGEFFNASNNPDLYCIVVDDIDYSTANWTNIDPASTFKENETDCALSMGDNAFELDVTIYPNPTDNYLFIEGNVNPVSITIYNLLGAEVIAKSNTDKIDVSELSKGVYIINISDGVSQTNRKFIKN